MTASVESELTALNFTYAQAVRTQDEQSWGQTWAHDATWTLSADRSVVGREEIVAMWVKAMANYGHVVQHYLAASYDVDDSAGVASGQIQLIEFTKTTDGEAGIMSGHYDDTYVRVNGGWLFQSRALTIFYRGAPDLTGLFR